MAMSPGGEIRSGGAADVDHRVINRVADGTDIFLGSPRRRADHAGFHQRDAECGKDKNAADKQSQRHGVAHRRQPGRSNRADQEIGCGQDEVGHRQRAAKAETVGGGSAEDGEKPYHAAEQASQSPGLFGGEIQFLLQVQGERSKGSVVGKTFENLADVRDPEGSFEAGADLLETFGKGQSPGLLAHRHRTTSSPATNKEPKILLLEHASHNGR